MFRDIYLQVTMAINGVYKIVEQKIKSNKVANKIINRLFKKWIRRKTAQNNFYNIVQKYLLEKDKDQKQVLANEDMTQQKENSNMDAQNNWGSTILDESNIVSFSQT